MPRPSSSGKRKRSSSSTSSSSDTVPAKALPKVADDRIIIAVDFGTTFSGVAYAFNVPGKTPDVVSIMDWPGE